MDSSLERESITQIAEALIYVKRLERGGYGGWKLDLLGDQVLSKSEEKLLLCAYCRGLLRGASLLEVDGKHELRCSVCLPQKGKLSVLAAQINREAIREREANCPIEKCMWADGIEKLRHHLEVECQWLPIPCPLSCAPLSEEMNWGVNRVERRLMESHLDEYCPMRLTGCESCAEVVKAIKMNAHLEECEDYLVPCPNACEEFYENKKIKRRDITRHLLEVCPLEEVDCPYSEFGCEVSLERRLVEEHEKSYAQNHMKLSLEGMRSKIKYLEKNNQDKDNEILFLRKGIREIRSNLTPLKGGFTWRFRGIKKIEKCESAHSDSFYIGQYKFQMFIVWKHKNLCCFIRIVKGAWDDALSWPVVCDYTFILHSHDELCNDKVLKSCGMNVSNSLFERKCFAKPLELPFTSYGYSDFISIADLKSGRYIQDDEMTLEIIMELGTTFNQGNLSLSSSLALPRFLEDTQPPKSGQLVWKIEGVKDSVRDGDVISSPVFYASLYKLQCRIYLNDRDSGYAGCYVYILKGEWDFNLVWPFRGKYTFTLINHDHEDRNYSQYSLTDNEDDVARYFSKPTTNSADGWGKQMFIENTKLLCEKYIRNDTITLEVCVEVFS